MGAGRKALTGTFGHRQAAGFIGRPIGDFRIEPFAPYLYARVQHAPPQQRHHALTDSRLAAATPHPRHRVATVKSAASGRCDGRRGAVRWSARRRPSHPPHRPSQEKRFVTPDISGSGAPQLAKGFMRSTAATPQFYIAGKMWRLR